ncbi:MAG: hypothetical protein HYR90_05070 [Candidatus Andersenbacteria bacterium]|nr:hypothetical protein [Candidatus Andersenbacteria bacterium]MBI3250739.1 hypothetical protein [Candidatus Andersenbacteria bacterium]
MNMPSFLRPKRALFAVVAGVVIVVLALLIWVSIILLRQSANNVPAIPFFGTLPGSDILQRLVDQGTTPAPTSPTPTSSVLATPTLPPTSVGQNLEVTVTFTRTPQFTFHIESVGFTGDAPNVADFDPRNGDRFFNVNVIGTSNQTIATYPTMIATTEIAENATSAQIRPYDNSRARIILPATTTPLTGVELRSVTGALLDSQTISSSEISLLDIKRKLAALRGAFTGWRPVVLAQDIPLDDPCQALAPVDPETGQPRSLSHYTIAITNEGTTKSEEEVKVILEQIETQADAMISTISPWSLYAPCIDAVIAVNDQTFGDCVLTQGAFPSCPNQKTVPRQDGDVSIVVHLDTPCDCTTTPENFPAYTVVGTGISTNMLAHALGHATGKMTDEYLYQQNNTYSLPGKNCFPTQEACSSFASSSGIGIECTSGCSTVEEYRPSTAIMHKTMTGTYGEFETCILRNKLARAIGFRADDEGGHINPACDGSGGQSRPQDPAPQGEYFGGRRVF